MIEKGPGWSHSLHLIEFSPDLTNFLKINSAELAQTRFNPMPIRMEKVVAVFSACQSFCRTRS
jgi:hypothetical protein